MYKPSSLDLGGSFGAIDSKNEVVSPCSLLFFYDVFLELFFDFFDLVDFLADLPVDFAIDSS